MERREDGQHALGWRDVLLILALIAVLAATVAFQASAHAATPRPSQTAADVLDHAAQLYDRQDYRGAQAEYERATKMDPGSIGAWRGLGACYWQLGEHDRAVQVWNDVLKVRPNDPDILMELGNAAAASQQPEQALELYNRVLTLRPRRASAMVARARVHLQNDYVEAAEPDLRNALELSPNDVEALLLLAQVCKATGRDGEADRIYQRLAKQGTAAGARYPREMADVYLELDRPADAVPLYRRNLQANPDNRGTVLGLARAHAKLHEYDLAIERLEDWLGKHPEDAKIREELARFANSAGDYDRAVHHLEILVADHPDESKWRVSEAQALRNKGDLDGATRMANEVLSDEPGNIQCLQVLLDAALAADRKTEVALILEKLAEADPTAKRFDRLGTEYVAIGDGFATHERTPEARAAYLKAGAAFQRAVDLDPLNADARQGVISAQRLAGNYAQAIAQAQQVIDKWPSAEWGWRELYQARLEQEDYAEADRVMQEWLKRNPGNVRVRQEEARARFKKGEHAQAIADLQQLLKGPIRPGVPVLLYHGLSLSAPSDESMPVKNFRDQMEALKDANYTPITVQQLAAFYHDNTPLPPRPVLITFDDARADSVRYADPVLQDLGFKATMFTPVSEVGAHGDFNSTWPELKKLVATGRWDLQCHSWFGHSMMPIDGQGAGGVFLANRRWVADEKRLESRAEYTARIDNDYKECASELRKQVPGLKLVAYAYPFGEMGQKSLSNEPKAAEINAGLVLKYYQIAFVQDPAAEVTRTSPAAALPRFEVPWNFSGRDLIHHLRSIDAYGSTELALADLYSWDGRYAEARKILDDVRKASDVDDATVLVRRGEIAMWEGDFAGARRDMGVAGELRPSDASVQGVAQIDKRTRPRLSFDGEGTSDNKERQSLIGGPLQEVHLTDRLSLAATARYRMLADNKFDQTKVDPTWAGGPIELRANGGEAQAELAYRWNWRGMVSLTGGTARFSDDSSAPVFTQDRRSFTLATFGLDLPIGDDLDVGARAKRAYVPAAGAVLTGLGMTGREAHVQYRPWRDTIVESDLQRVGYTDGNKRNIGQASIMQRLNDTPELQIGYRFRYDDTARENPYFYSPNRFTGNDGVIKVVAKAAQYHSLELEIAGGYGSEAGSGGQFENTLLGTWRYELPDHYSFYVGGGRDQAAQFRSVGVSAGLALTF